MTGLIFWDPFSQHRANKDQGNSSHINYLSKSTNGKIDLIQGDADTFADVLGLINSYEGMSGQPTAPPMSRAPLRLRRLPN